MLKFLFLKGFFIIIIIMTKFVKAPTILFIFLFFFSFFFSFYSLRSTRTISLILLLNIINATASEINWNTNYRQFLDPVTVIFFLVILQIIIYTEYCFNIISMACNLLIDNFSLAQNNTKASNQTIDYNWYPC